MVVSRGVAIVFSPAAHRARQQISDCDPRRLYPNTGPRAREGRKMESGCVLLPDEIPELGTRVLEAM